MTISILGIFNLSALGSCLVSVRNGGPAYRVSVWKHTDGQDDSVETSNYTADSLKEISFYLQGKKCLTFIFNDGVFTSMRYDQETTKRWANLSQGEKDMIAYVQSRFNTLENAQLRPIEYQH